MQAPIPACRTAKFLTPEERAFATHRMGPFAPKVSFSHLKRPIDRRLTTNAPPREPTSTLTNRRRSTA